MQTTLAQWDGTSMFVALHHEWEITVHHSTGEQDFHGVPHWVSNALLESDSTGEPITMTDPSRADLTRRLEQRFDFTSEMLLGNTPGGDVFAHGGKREGAGRPTKYTLPMPSVSITARDGDFLVLQTIGDGSISEGIRRLVNQWHRSHYLYHPQDGQTLHKQVTISQRTIDQLGIRFIVDVATADDATQQSFLTEAEAIRYAQEVIGRDLKPFSVTDILGQR